MPLFELATERFSTPSTIGRVRVAVETDRGWGEKTMRASISIRHLGGRGGAAAAFEPPPGGAPSEGLLCFCRHPRRPVNNNNRGR
jgi:hypothetical protein